jgi:hypothetical protein
MSTPVADTSSAGRAGRRSPGPGEVLIEFLDAFDAEDRKAWIDLWESWPDREMTAHPSFVALFARDGDGVVCAAARTERGGALYPVIIRPLSRERWGSPDEKACDLTTAYAYGGPFAWNLSDAEATVFWKRFAEWAREIGAATAFARLALFPEMLLPFDGETLDRGPNVIVKLAPSEDEIWRNYDGKVRRNVQKARGSGVTVVSDFHGERLDDFMRVYESTMDRRGALDHYYFPRAMFETLIAELPGRFVFMHALAGGAVVSSDLMLLSERHAYYWLGGMQMESFALRPNDLLKHETFLECKRLGKESVVLGGAYTPDDGLIRYKRAFAPGSEARFRIGVRTYDPLMSDRLIAQRKRWERSHGRDWNPAEGFFPPYRS